MQSFLSKSTSSENPVSWFSARGHGLTLLLIVTAALTGSGLVSRNVAANPATVEVEKKLYAIPMAAPVARVSVEVQEPTAASKTLTAKHLLKDAAMVFVCLLAASLWWLARSP